MPSGFAAQTVGSVWLSVMKSVKKESKNRESTRKNAGRSTKNNAGYRANKQSPAGGQGQYIDWACEALRLGRGSLQSGVGTGGFAGGRGLYWGRTVISNQSVINQ